MMNEKAIQDLQALGFNHLEAMVYVKLLQHPGSTPYQIGKALGKATANVYKAMEVLRRRGAVMMEDGKHQHCVAVPVEELIGKLQADFNLRAATVRDQLAQVQTAAKDEKIYRLENASLLLEKARKMLDNAQSVIVADAFPVALKAITPALERARDRGVRIFVQAYAPYTMDGAQVCLPSASNEALKMWKSEQLNLVVDAGESLIALLNKNLEQVIQAIWTHNLYLSTILHSGRLKENYLFQLKRIVDEGGDIKAVHDFFDQMEYLHNSSIPGTLELLRQNVYPEFLPQLNIDLSHN